MNTTQLIVGLFSLGTAAAVNAEMLRLNDGTVVEGELDAPAEVIIKTAAGERRIAFSLLPAAVQQRYWRKSAEQAAMTSAATAAQAPTTEAELGVLAAEVNLETWAGVTAIASFRDKPERRGTGGLIVEKAFNALEQNWFTVYSPADPVGQAGDWSAQVARAKGCYERSTQFVQRRWLELFIKAGEAIVRKDSGEFASSVREMRRSPLGTVAMAQPETELNFFTAK